MPGIHHEIAIDAPPDAVFRAIAEPDGLRRFWTDQVDGDARLDGRLSFGFGPDRETVFDMRIDRLEPGHLVAWHCVGGPDEWQGTNVRWELTANDTGGTRLRFHHEGWARNDQDFPACSFTWAMILDRLRTLATAGAAEPWFRQDG